MEVEQGTRFETFKLYLPERRVDRYSEVVDVELMNHKMMERKAG